MKERDFSELYDDSVKFGKNVRIVNKLQGALKN